MIDEKMMAYMMNDRPYHMANSLWQLDHMTSAQLTEAAQWLDARARTEQQMANSLRQLAQAKSQGEKVSALDFIQSRIAMHADITKCEVDRNLRALGLKTFLRPVQ